jgi:hypothetical protein
MNIELTALVYLPTHTSMEEVTSGKWLPVFSVGDNPYYEKEGYPIIGTATITISLHSRDDIVAKQIKSLNAQLQAVRAENYQREAVVLDKIKNLQALTLIPEQAP